ncbi:endonuclease/exonuclease/phosphatase family protein [Trichocoleus sp. FACHB-262]|uniref:endonuclease/exonuclease/phosphatase family protein n=1 Tax=Trichocoleus sp. FACHB-262 TaxID=2692869 RepID=UPI001683EBF7|nr:endonuclease/exonuclease/phosphatase family protein [Trichocoleus sp. FACHB-262]MBD2120398.1 endonuclease/exonuclease/phosphatase family protein [Trichocoleus sp. FACHB-262]
MIFFNLVLWIPAIALLGLSLVTAWWYKFWLLEILGTGYLWFAGATLLLWISLLLIKPLRPKRGLQIVLAIALIFYAQFTLSWYIPRLRDMKSGGAPVTVMTYNVNYQLWNTTATEKLIRAYPADIFSLVEPTKEQATELWSEVKDLYPHYYRATGGNLSLFSRYPIQAAKTDNLQSAHQSLFATLEISGKTIQVVAVRPPAPQNKNYFNRRNQVLRSLAAYTRQQKTPLIVMGDFNTTAWSFYLHEFSQRSGLRNASVGHGLHPTWYYATSGKATPSTHKFFQFIKIPLDHIFVSPSIRVDQVMTAPPGVSDHRPLIAKLRV